MMTVEVKNVEVLGTETLLSFEMGEKEQWIARWSGQWDVQVGDRVDIVMDEKDFVLFDQESGQCLVTGESIQGVLA